MPSYYNPRFFEDKAGYVPFPKKTRKQFMHTRSDPKNDNVFFLSFALKKLLTKMAGKCIFACVSAEVAELVDALGSGSSGRMLVGVRLSPSAPSDK